MIIIIIKKKASFLLYNIDKSLFPVKVQHILQVDLRHIVDDVLVLSAGDALLA